MVSPGGKVVVPVCVATVRKLRKFRWAWSSICQGAVTVQGPRLCTVAVQARVPSPVHSSVAAEMERLHRLHGVGVRVGVVVRVGVAVRVTVAVRVGVVVRVGVAVRVTVAVRVGVRVTVAVRVGVAVRVAVSEIGV